MDFPLSIQCREKADLYPHKNIIQSLDLELKTTKTSSAQRARTYFISCLRSQINGFSICLENIHKSDLLMKAIRILVLVFVSLPSFVLAQHEHSRTIDFPDIEGFRTLKVDLHMHSVFSDGAVWPDIRVKEAIRDGLDAISLTEHLEYQPHADDIPHPDRNRAYELALEYAKDSELLIIPGAEVTRDMPPGHSNAVFIEDANRLLQDDPRIVFEEVKTQGGFTFWDHPNWTAQRKDGVARLTDMHRSLIQDGLMSGIEVVNEDTYSDEALEIALEHNLAIIGTSDIHGLIDWDYHPHDGGHRPVTLVFATDKSLDAIHEALRERRTAVWHKNILIGKDLVE